MKIKTIIQILFLAISLNTYSQIVFNNTYDLDSGRNSFSSQIQLFNGDFIVADQTELFLDNNLQSYIARVDEFGDVIWEKK
jgi:hypothetical protein